MRIVLSRWAVSLFGVVLLAGLVWLFGPLLSALEGWVPRLVVVAGLLIVWAVANGLLVRRRRRRDRALVDGVTAGADAAPKIDARGEEAAALQGSLSSALALLKRASGRSGYLYEQPWYVIIGPPGAGKTTALLNAGLTFPLAAEMGQGAVAGVGGTRLCDWWFTEQAVLIDTAGRYTTQDSDAAVDRAGWEAFLGLLARTRPRQPLNGVLVAIALSDIAAAPAAERTAHARAIRRRVKELEAKLGVRVPVYALFTKADLVAGFREFFDDLDRERRDQVWGVTFPITDGSGAAPGITPATGFPEELRLLVKRLDDRLLERLQAERSPDRRGLIAGFPTQVATLEQPLATFLNEAFGGSRLDPAPLLRGAYFTSGTQEGTPIDRLTGVMTRSFGLDQARLPSLRPERGRSYFLARLLRDVVFNEAMLVSAPPGTTRRRLALRIGAFAAIALVAIGIGALMLVSRGNGQRELDTTAKALAAYEQTGRGLPLDPVADADLARLAPLLDAARAMPHRTGEPGGFTLWGLSPDATLEAGAQAVYRHAVGYALLPRLVWRLESQMRGAMNRPDFLYEATRVYLMLGGGGRLDRDLVREWMALDWQAAYPGAFNAALRQSLAQHLDALLAAALPPLTLDGALVEQAQAAFSNISVAARVYSRIKPSAAAQHLPPWLPSEAMGANVQLFTRASDKPMTDGIPGFFTVQGFHKVLLPALAPAMAEVASESWVLGKRAQISADPAAFRALEQQVIQLYEADYATAWDAMLRDLNVRPLSSGRQAAQSLFILASPQSPMRDLLVSAARELTLSVPPAPPAGVTGAVQGTVLGAAGATGSRLEGLVGVATGAPALPPGHEIDERYKTLRNLVAGGPAAPIEQVLKVLMDLAQVFVRQEQSIGSPTPAAPTGNDPALALRSEAERQPEPVSRWLRAMSTSAVALRGGGVRQQVQQAYNGTGGPAELCTKAVNGRFPFVPGSAMETPMDDFGKLFSPGGLIDGFFNTQLRPYVDTSGKPWKPQTVESVPAPVTPADLLQFQRAAIIRDLFFSGGTTPAVRFDITPVESDTGSRQVTLDFDGTSVTFAHGPPRATQVTWPGATRMLSVRLVFDPPPTGGTGVLAESGPWAMFRLFGRGRLSQADTPEKYRLVFTLGERSITYEVRASSVINPFSPGILQDFKCPAVQ